MLYDLFIIISLKIKLFTLGKTKPKRETIKFAKKSSIYLEKGTMLIIYLKKSKIVKAFSGSDLLKAIAADSNKSTDFLVTLCTSFVLQFIYL